MGIIIGGVLLALIVIGGALITSLLMGGSLTAQEALSALKVRLPAASTTQGLPLTAPPAARDEVRLIMSPQGVWSAAKRLLELDVPVTLSKTEVNERGERSHPVMVEALLRAPRTNAQLVQREDLLAIDERLTLLELWVAASSAREAHAQLQASRPLPVRLALQGTDQEELKALSFELSASPVKRIGGLRLIWGQDKLTMLTNLQGELAPVGKLPLSRQSELLTRNVQVVLERLSWPTLSWVSFEAPASTPLSQLTSIMRLVTQLSEPALAQRGAPLSMIIHLTP